MLRRADVPSHKEDHIVNISFLLQFEPMHALDINSCINGVAFALPVKPLAGSLVPEWIHLQKMYETKMSVLVQNKLLFYTHQHFRLKLPLHLFKYESTRELSGIALVIFSKEYTFIGNCNKFI